MKKQEHGNPERIVSPCIIGWSTNVAAWVETFAGGGSDADGWDFGLFALDGDDHGGSSASMSLHGAATQAAPGTTTHRASVTVALGPDPRLSYWRKLDLRALST